MPSYGQWHKGITKSPEIQAGFDDLINADVHTNLGTCIGQLALVKDSSTTLTEATIAITLPDGKVQFLSKSSGKQWQRTTAGVYSLVNTNANGAHLGGGVFNNRFWYVTSTKVGYYDLNVTYSDSHGTFAAGAAYHPFLKTGVNQAFAYFGDGDQIASINKDNTFNANALDIPLGETVTDLAEWGDDVVFSSFVGANVQEARMYRWDQYSDTYYSPDIIPSAGVAMLLPSSLSNELFALCVTEELIMRYTGASLNQYKFLRGETVSINPYAKTQLNGRTYFGIGDTVYSLHTTGPEFDFALVKEFTISSAGGTIDSMCTTGSTIIVTWTASGGASFGADKIDTNRADVVVITPIFEGKPTKVHVYYRELPSGTSITARASINGGAYTSITMRDEPENNRFAMYGGFPGENVNFCQVEVTGVHSTTSTPELSRIVVE